MTNGYIFDAGQFVTMTNMTNGDYFFNTNQLTQDPGVSLRGNKFMMPFIEGFLFGIVLMAAIVGCYLANTQK